VPEQRRSSASASTTGEAVASGARDEVDLTEDHSRVVTAAARGRAAKELRRGRIGKRNLDDVDARARTA
jgi:hypothetical protein